MKVELNRVEFLKAWQMAEHSSSSKTTVNAAGGVLINAAEETALEATDFKTAIHCPAAGVTTLSPGSAVLPVRLLGEFFKKIQAENLTLEVEDEHGVLTAGRNKTRFITPPVSEFPNIPRSDSGTTLCSVLATDLARVIAEGSIASSTPADLPRYLGTCQFRVKDSLLKVVSTDGKRLSLSQCPCETETDKEFLLPIPALKELSRLLSGSGQDSRVEVLYDGAIAWFRIEGVEFSIRSVETSFPNYEKILTSDVLTTLRIPREEFLSALERIDIIARNTVAHIVVMQLSPGGDLRMTTRAPDFGTALEVLDANIDGNPLRVGFNVGYFQDGLRALGTGEVLVEFNGEEGQTRVVQDGVDNFLYMLMPARLSPQDILDEDEEESGGPESGL
jgi:DNA polymerase-3 subunit beta